MSKFYIVKVEEVYTSHMLIEADSEEDALAHWPSGDELRCEYTYTPDNLGREVEEFHPLDYTKPERDKACIHSSVMEKMIKESENGE
jgi:hypothetical protein